MCCSREHYPSVAKEWTASTGEHHQDWPPVFYSARGAKYHHAHLALDDQLGACVYADDPREKISWEDWAGPNVQITRFKVGTGEMPTTSLPSGVYHVNSINDDTWGWRWAQYGTALTERGITTMSQAVLWVTEGDCLQQVGYLPETPTYAEWLKMDTLVRPH